MMLTKKRIELLAHPAIKDGFLRVADKNGGIYPRKYLQGLSEFQERNYKMWLRYGAQSGWKPRKWMIKRFQFEQAVRAIFNAHANSACDAIFELMNREVVIKYTINDIHTSGRLS